MTDKPTIQWWLAELDRYGNPRLCDGSHSQRAGAEKAMYLYGRLGLAGDEKYVICRVEVYPATATPHGVDEKSITVLNEIGLNS